MVEKTPRSYKVGEWVWSLYEGDWWEAEIKNIDGGAKYTVYYHEWGLIHDGQTSESLYPFTNEMEVSSPSSSKLETNNEQPRQYQSSLTNRPTLTRRSSLSPSSKRAFKQKSRGTTAAESNADKKYYILFLLAKGAKAAELEYLTPCSETDSSPSGGGPSIDVWRMSEAGILHGKIRDGSFVYGSVWPKNPEYLDLGEDFVPVNDPLTGICDIYKDAERVGKLQSQATTKLLPMKWLSKLKPKELIGCTVVTKWDNDTVHDAIVERLNLDGNLTVTWLDGAPASTAKGGPSTSSVSLKRVLTLKAGVRRRYRIKSPALKAPGSPVHYQTTINGDEVSRLPGNGTIDGGTVILGTRIHVGDSEYVDLGEGAVPMIPTKDSKQLLGQRKLIPFESVELVDAQSMVGYLVKAKWADGNIYSDIAVDRAVSTDLLAVRRLSVLGFAASGPEGRSSSFHVSNVINVLEQLSEKDIKKSALSAKRSLRALSFRNTRAASQARAASDTYDVDFNSKSLGLKIAPHDNHGLPTVQANDRAIENPYPRVGDVVIGVNGIMLKDNDDPYSALFELIKGAGRPVKLTFKRHANEAQSFVKGVPDVEAIPAVQKLPPCQPSPILAGRSQSKPGSAVDGTPPPPPARAGPGSDSESEGDAVAFAEADHDEIGIHQHATTYLLHQGSPSAPAKSNSDSDSSKTGATEDSSTERDSGSGSDISYVPGPGVANGVTGTDMSSGSEESTPPALGFAEDVEGTNSGSHQDPVDGLSSKVSTQSPVDLTLPPPPPLLPPEALDSEFLPPLPASSSLRQTNLRESSLALFERGHLDKKQGTPTDNKQWNETDYFALIDSIYAAKAPGKRQTVAATLQTWKGHEEQLLEMLQAKYGKVEEDMLVRQQPSDNGEASVPDKNEACQPEENRSLSDEEITDDGERQGTEYEVAFVNDTLGLVLQHDESDRPIVIENNNSSGTLPNDGDLVVGVNGVRLHIHHDPYHEMMTLITEAGRPLSLTFQRGNLAEIKLAKDLAAAYEKELAEEEKEHLRGEAEAEAARREVVHRAKKERVQKEAEDEAARREAMHTAELAATIFIAKVTAKAFDLLSKVSKEKQAALEAHNLVEASHIFDEIFLGLTLECAESSLQTLRFEQQRTLNSVANDVSMKCLEDAKRDVDEAEAIRAYAYFKNTEKIAVVAAQHAVDSMLEGCVSRMLRVVMVKKKFERKVDIESQRWVSVRFVRRMLGVAVDLAEAHLLASQQRKHAKTFLKRRVTPQGGTKKRSRRGSTFTKHAYLLSGMAASYTSKLPAMDELKVEADMANLVSTMGIAGVKLFELRNREQGLQARVKKVEEQLGKHESDWVEDAVTVLHLSGTKIAATAERALLSHDLETAIHAQHQYMKKLTGTVNLLEEQVIICKDATAEGDAESAVGGGG